MSFALRTAGVLFVILASAMMCWELYVLADTGNFTLTSWGELWFGLHAPSLNLYQAGVERYLSPALWDQVLAPLLLWPAVLVFLIPGVLLVWLPRLSEMLRTDNPQAER